jgi:spermidine synthase
VRWLFLLAYTCSGLAGLIYEVSWTRLLTLYVGHTTAAASAVVGAFLAGLAVGAGVGGRWSASFDRRRALAAYAALELAVAVAALVLPLEIRAMAPALAWAYAGGSSSWLFPALRLASCLLIVFVPALALGATFPVATRYLAADSDLPAGASSWLYALNTAGAAAGALLAGFVLIPTIGLTATVGLGVAASSLAAMLALIVRARQPAVPERSEQPARSQTRAKPGSVAVAAAAREQALPWLAAGVLGVTGFASLMHEMVWTRVLALVLGPTIYAFAATLAAVITGVAAGSALGAAVVSRSRRPATWLALALAIAALATAVTSALAGTYVPRVAAAQWADVSDDFSAQLTQSLALTAAMILPTAISLGAAFPLALAIVGATSADASRRFGLVYAINTIGAVTGSLAAGFVFVPWLGLRATLIVVNGCLIAAGLAVAVRARARRTLQVAGAAAIAAAAAVVAISPPWDRELLASGAYLYAPFVPRDLDLETLLKAGTLLYYREGAAATVSVKRLTGTTTLAVDGKTDASNRGDMLTQKLVAHLPLLLHDAPRTVGIIGLGSGVTLGAALQHPITRADVVEISPEVVEASQYFAAENQNALADARTRLIVGDGRSHLLLTSERYDVIVSEPSNPWIAGVAALFTREFFDTVRARLAPGGIICQWANAYTISDADLRAIVATFRRVFPDGTAWLVGTDDVLLVGSTGERPIGERLDAIAAHWSRAGVAADLARVAVDEPFSILSLFAGGPAELEAYASGAAVLTDDTMALEFSAPREIRRRDSGQNSAALAALRERGTGAPAVKAALRAPTASQWRHRARMMGARDAHGVAYDDYLRALRLDPEDQQALDGLVRTATLVERPQDALASLGSIAAGRPETVARLIARSRLQAAAGNPGEAVGAARRALEIAPGSAAALEQLASLHADSGDVAALEPVVDALRTAAPRAASTCYYEAVLALLKGSPEEAMRLATEATAIDPGYAPVYDLLGAAATKLGRADAARAAFERSLRFDAHDSTAYTNLGWLALAEGDRRAAIRHFAEALWLVPESRVAREGLARARR